MFEWQNKRMDELKRENSLLEEKIQMDDLDKEELEKFDSIRQFVELMSLEEVRDYICLVYRISSYKKKINYNEKVIKKIENEICLHRILYYVDDVTDEHFLIDGCHYYKCICLECGITHDFIFSYGERKNSILVCPESGYSYDEAREKYLKMKENGLYFNEIREEFENQKFVKIRKRSLLK